MTSAEVIAWRIVEVVGHLSSWLFRRRWWRRVATTPPPNKSPGPAEDRVEQRQAPLTALSRSGWMLSSSPTGTGLTNATDGTASTRWRTGVAQAANQFFQVDMLSPRTFGAIRLDTTGTPTEFPGSYKVQVANDNVSWGTAPNVATGSGAIVATISFPPQTARYIRITLMPGTTGASWSIHEFNVYDTRLSRTGWTATASVNNGNAGLAIDATAATRWNTVVGTNNTQVNGQSLTVNMAIPQTFNQLTLDTGSSVPTQFPRGYTITTSNDGTNFSAAIPTTAGATGQLTVINFATQVARYVRITLSGLNPSPFNTPWAVEELNVIGQPTSLTTQPRAVWTASGTTAASGTSLAGPIDTTAGNRWTANTVASGTFYQVDMGTYRLFNQITVDAGTMTGNFPRNYRVEISNNATTWTQIVAPTANSAVLLTINVQPQTARHIKISLTAANPTGSPWSIQELNVAGQALSPANWVASASSSSTGNGAGQRHRQHRQHPLEHQRRADQLRRSRWTWERRSPSTSSRSTRGRRRPTSRATTRFSSRTTGRTSDRPIATGTGTGQLVTINLLTQTARAIKIQTPVTPADANVWSIQELGVWRIAQPCDSVTCTAQRPVPRRGRLRPEYRRVLEPEQDEWDDVRQRPVHDG